MSVYCDVGERVRARLLASRAHKDLLATARRLQRSCETLDLTAVGIANNLRDERFGEAQLRCDAAEREAEALLDATRRLAIQVRDARLARSVAA